MNATFKMLEKAGYKKGYKEGYREGYREVKLEASAALIFRRLSSQFGRYPDFLKARVKSCPCKSTMYLLVDAAYQCESLAQFEDVLDSLLDEKSEPTRLSSSSKIPA